MANWCDVAKPSDSDPCLDLSLLECALYDSIHGNSLLVDLAVSDAISPKVFFEQQLQQDPVFFYRYLVYAKLRENGW